MRPRIRGVLVAAITLYLVALTGPSGLAYIDPGSGSYLFQLLIGFLLGAGLAIRAFWGRIRAFFGGRKDEGPSDARREGLSGPREER